MKICAVAFAFIVLDFITGIVYALSKKQFKSSVMREGLWHKLASIIGIVIGIGLDYAQSIADLGFSIPAMNSICVYIILMECGSIIENIGKINSKILPKSITSLFKSLNEE